ncbi:hypothetical protein RHMOL_Rhmol04G0223900 [Rhododendron molle]|uniref:Uncharacterized protein n=1 Tax=Rhododendron molle TaxID=49168 RepID=A0ACC0P3J6_RHOML|nr:hypothetical protein RHMOL_Rhmol04G0223900 [Rhododendron molle]
MVADVEAEEREAEEAQGPRVSAVTEAGAMKRPEFPEETYTPPRPHLFVPSGFAGYKPPQQTNYNVELVLRDPRVHIANTWAEGNPAEVQLVPARIEPAAVTVQVPVEWVNEAVRRMLALENVVRRAAYGFPLELRYPAPTAQPAQTATPRRTQPAAASKEAARKAAARPEEQYRIERRGRSGQGEPARKKQLVLVQPPEKGEEEERGKEEDEEARSDSDNTVDDFRFLQDPRELAADDDEDDDDDGGDDGDDIEEDLGDTDWLGRDEDV